MHPLLAAYRRAGCRTTGDVLALARTRGPRHLAEAVELLREAPEYSTAMVIVPGEPPGKNVCAFVRQLLGTRTKLIVGVRPGGLAPGAYERMLRASMPDVEKKLRIMDVGDSVADAVSSAERNRHYRPSQALEVYADSALTSQFSQDVRGGRLNFDPTVIQANPTQVPTDDAGAIREACRTNDPDALHRVLDPHIFSSPEGIQQYRAAAGGTGTNEAVLLVRHETVSVAGLCIMAADTGRVLMIQRALGDSDPAGGTWEFPGGHIEEGESPLDAAYREWQEEVRSLLPAGSVKRFPDSMWVSPNGIYVGFVVTVACEDDLSLHDREQVRNPDDPGGDSYEAVAWWAPEQLLGMPALRPELSDDLAVVIDAICDAAELTEVKNPNRPGIRKVNELGGIQAAPQAGPQSQMRGSNSSAWAGGRLVLKKPENFIPDDENASERDGALDQDMVGGGLDWGVGRVRGSF